MKDWTRNDKLAFAGVAVSILGIGIALLQPVMGSGNSSVNVTIPARATPMLSKEPADKPADKSISVNIPGSNNNVKFLPLRRGKARGQELNIIGEGGNQTVFVAPEQSVEVNVPGSNNTVRVARSLTAQVIYNSQGMQNTEVVVDDPK